MTRAICLACGEAKSGAFVRCQRCEYLPQSGWEMTVSVICSDNIMSHDSLIYMGKDISHAKNLGDTYEWNFDDGAKVYIDKRMSEPSWRDMLTIRREAKSGWLRKQMNWHHFGANGYRHQLLTRGAEISKSKFDQISLQFGTDVFLIDAYENGSINSAQTEKTIWYCMMDVMSFPLRLLKVNSFEEEVIIDLAETYTMSFMQREFGICI